MLFGEGLPTERGDLARARSTRCALGRPAPNKAAIKWGRANENGNQVALIAAGHTEQHGFHLPLNTDSLIIGAIAVIGVVAFPTDPGWGVVSVPGRLHPIFALLAAGMAHRAVRA